MPVLITPSMRTAALWGLRSHYPVRLEVTVIVLAVLALPFMTAYAVQRVDLKAMPSTQQNPIGSIVLSYPGPPHSTDVVASIFLFIFPLLVNLTLSCLNLFWFYSLHTLHPIWTLICSTVLSLFWAINSIFTVVGAANTTSELAKHLGLSIPVACVGALCTLAIAATYFVYVVYSALAVYTLQSRGPSTDPNKSRYGSNYASSFPGSIAGSTKKMKLFHTPTRERFSSEYSTHINSPIQRDEEDMLTVRDGTKSPSSRSFTAKPGGNAIPPIPEIPDAADTAPPVPAKGPSAVRNSTVKSMKSTRSAPGLRSPLSPRSPRSPVSRRGTSGLRRSATTAGQQVETRTRKERETNFSKAVQQENGGFVGCRERGASLEGKAKRELQRVRLKELDTKAAERYRYYGQQSKAGKVLGS